MEFGLALAGGGTRGAAHVGVLMALEEAKLLPTSLAGTSAGSLVAGLYAAGVDTASLRELLIYLAKKGSRYIDVDCGGLLKFIPQMIRRRPVSLQGLIKGDRLLALMTRLTAEAGLLTFEQMEDCLEAGYTYTKAHIGEVRDALAASDRKRRAFNYSLR